MLINRNVECVHFHNFQNFYFEKNHNFAGKKINKIVAFAPESVDLSQILLTLTNSVGETIVKNTPLSLLSWKNNNVPLINDILDLSNCYITAVGSQQTTSLHLIVFYDCEEIDAENFKIRESVSVRGTIKNGEELKIENLIDNYIKLQGKDVKGVSLESDKLIFLTMIDESREFVFKDIPSALLRLPYFSTSATDGQKDLFLLNSINVDMNNSYLKIESIETANFTLTFYY